MGPTASGKTDVAIALCERFPLQIISVDSALVYRGMNIGTAKPDTDTLRRAPHRLINIREPHEKYSAGEFVRDAEKAMHEIWADGDIPLLVGGTMLYFRALTEGIAELPAGDAEVRAQIDADAERLGWPAMHAKLAEIDAIAAARINANDSQRIQRALEVFAVSGRTLSEWQDAPTQPTDAQFIKIALQPERAVLHERIEQRLDAMLANGFLEEVTKLMQEPKLDRELPSMRAVGYRQIWTHLAGELTREEGRYRALVATRQLAKRQVTWLRSETDLFSVNPLEGDAIAAISTFLASKGGIFAIPK
ncbi:MAG: tRNA (adenosine(37)-N6)-dimethylallyltransferase MiaA [Pseudomonadota bacterium]